jgi:hypothetical protein
MMEALRKVRSLWAWANKIWLPKRNYQKRYTTRMNFLSFTVSTNPIYGLAFDLLIDEKTPSQALYCDELESSIPFWLIEGDLPAPDESQTSSPECDRIVAICGCGEFVCGGTIAQLTKYRDTVVCSNFRSSSSEASSAAFTFTRPNYDEVLRQMTEIAGLYKDAQRAGRLAK